MIVVRALLIAILLATALGHGASAHAVLLEAEPSDGAIIARPPAAIHLHFNESVTPVSIRVIGPDGKMILLQDRPTAVDQDVGVRLPERLANGGYIVSYRVISLDTHPVGGSLSFVIGSGSEVIPSLPAGSGERWEKAFPFAHGLMLICLALVLGSALFRAFVDETVICKSYVPISTAVAVLAAIVEVGIRGAGLTDATISDFFSVLPWRIGLSTAMAPALGLIVIGVILSASGYAVSGNIKCRLLALSGVISGCMGLALISHAALAPPVLLAFPAFIIHTATAGFWFGSLPLLIVALARGHLAATTVIRFSAVAIWSVAALLAAGIVLTIVQTGSDIRVWTGPAWTESAYGPVLAVKIAVVSAILILAAYHKHYLTPRLTAGDIQASNVLRRSIRYEASLMIVVLALAASLGSFEPPRSIGALASVHDHSGSDGAALYVVRHGYGILLEMTPATTGSNEITLRFSDPSKDGARIMPKEVIIGLAQPAAGIEPLRRRAKPVEGGAYRVELMPVPTAGLWQIEVDALITDFDKLLTTIDVPIEAAKP